MNLGFYCICNVATKLIRQMLKTYQLHSEYKTNSAPPIFCDKQADPPICLCDVITNMLIFTHAQLWERKQISLVSFCLWVVIVLLAVSVRKGLEWRTNSLLLNWKKSGCSLIRYMRSLRWCIEKWLFSVASYHTVHFAMVSWAWSSDCL